MLSKAERRASRGLAWELRNRWHRWHRCLYTVDVFYEWFTHKLQIVLLQVAHKLQPVCSTMGHTQAPNCLFYEWVTNKLLTVLWMGHSQAPDYSMSKSRTSSKLSIPRMGTQEPQTVCCSTTVLQTHSKMSVVLVGHIQAPNCLFYERVTHKLQTVPRKGHTHAPNCLFQEWVTHKLQTILWVGHTQAPNCLFYERVTHELKNAGCSTIVSHTHTPNCLFHEWVTQKLQKVLWVGDTQAPNCLFYEWVTHELQTVFFLLWYRVIDDIAKCFKCMSHVRSKLSQFFCLFWNSVIRDIADLHNVLRVSHSQTANFFLLWNTVISNTAMCCTCRSRTSSKLSYFVYVLFWNSDIGDVADFVWCSASESHTQTPNCLYLWWSLCTLCLLLDVPLVEFTYLVFTRMPDESYRRRLRSLFLYLRYVFRALVTSLLCWFQTVLFFLLSASCFGTQVTAVVAARAIFYEWDTHKFQTVVFSLLFWNSVIGDICCLYDVLWVGHIHTSSKLLQFLWACVCSTDVMVPTTLLRQNWHFISV